MRTHCFAIGLLVLLSAGLCNAQEFSRYYGKDAVREGDGGEMTVIEGVDFWSNGSPPRQFRVLGYISDSRLKSGLVGMARMKGQAKAVARKAREAGGDAVIAMSSDTETTGYVSNAFAQGNRSGNSVNAGGTAITQAVQRNHARFMVLKYLDQEEGALGPDGSVPAGPDTSAQEATAQE